MRTHVVLAAVLAMVLAGWSSAEAGEARIESFVFGCETPDGKKLKPKFGDVDGVFYTDLPGQREQCLDAVERKISLCRENTSFESNTQDEKYAGCLPIFREQAKVCVGHFRLERHKCDTGVLELTATLDPSERKRVQVALAAEGFDPVPADGQFGPRTRRAIEGWQQTNGHPVTGALTVEQADALLEVSVAPLEPFGPNWSIVENQPCQVWNFGNAEKLEPFTWSGGCVDGKASGEGQLTWSGASYRGGMVDGKKHGQGVSTYASGTRHEGGWENGEPHGFATAIFSNGNRYEGEWREDKRHGRGTYTWADGDAMTCEWRDDESVDGTCEYH